MNLEYTRALRTAKVSYVEKARSQRGKLTNYDHGVLEGLEWALDKYYALEENK